MMKKKKVYKKITNQLVKDYDNCLSKKKFTSEHSAKKFVELQNLSNLVTEFYVYKCQLCSGWHIATVKN